MLEAMQLRLKELKSELEAGEAELARVENHRTYLCETLLRISGAVQVMEELLAEEPPEGQSTEQSNGTSLAASSGHSETRVSSVRTDESKQAI